MEGTREGVACEPADVAQWLGLADHTLLGPEPITLSAGAADKLRLYGGRAEMFTPDAAAVLRVSRRTVADYTRQDGVRLGHRWKGTRLLVSGADLAAFIAATRRPPVPTTGASPRRDEAARKRREDALRARHKMPARRS